jgi:hypothetical protein
VSPEWLAAILRNNSLLERGRVEAIAVRRNPAFNSVIDHLAVTFSADVSASVPRRLLLKRNLPAEWARPAGVHEAQFYQLVAQLPNHPAVIVPCLDAAFDAETRNSHLLLHDLSDSHAAPLTRDQILDPKTSVPGRAHLEAVIDTLACFHAYWWQHPRLGSGVALLGAWCSSEARFVSEIARRRRAWDDLWLHEQDWFPPTLRALYETILEHMLALWKAETEPRLATHTNLTLTHGDAYFANFLCPRPAHHGATYLLDWQSPEVYRATGDLVNLCATFWTREQRAQHEGWLLPRYHAGLRSHDVDGYTWDMLVTDYRCSIIDWLLQPLQDRLDGADRSYWYHKMRCLADAFDDWDCARLFARP